MFTGAAPPVLVDPIDHQSLVFALNNLAAVITELRNAFVAHAQLPSTRRVATTPGSVLAPVAVEPQKSSSASRAVSSTRESRGVDVDRSLSSLSLKGLASVRVPSIERKILATLARHAGDRNVGRESIGLSKVQLAILVGYSHTSKSFINALSSLRTSERVLRNGDRLVVTAKGRLGVGDIDPLPTGRALLVYWQQHVKDKAARMILEKLADAHPHGLEKAALARHVGYSHTSKSFINGLSRVRSLQLVDGKHELGLSPPFASGIFG